MLRGAFVTSKLDGGDTFNDIAQSNGEDFWKALKGPICSRLYNIHITQFNITKSDYGYIYNENKILGVARLRQVRVKPNSCELHKEFAKRNYTQGCYAAYTTRNEDKDSFGDSSLNIFTSDAWNYASAERTKTSVHSGVVSNYGGGGFVQLFTRNTTTTMDILEELERNSWINRGTRAIFFDVIVYNPNINLFCHVRLLAEYPSSGGAIPSTSIQAVKLIRIFKKRLLFLFNLWNSIDLILLILSFLCILFELLNYLSTKKYLGELLKIENDYPNFDELFALKINSDFYLGVTLAITWFKIFKYLNINKTMLLLNKTISSCLNEIFAFTSVFLIIFLAYTQLGWILFGRYLTEWRSFRISIFTLFRMILGDFDLYAMRNIGEIIGPLFLFSYIYFVYFVLLNMFLAIINETYSRIESDPTLETLKIRKFSLNFYPFIPRKKSIDYETNLKTRGYTDDDIRKIVHKYDTNKDGTLDEQEQKTMKHDLAKGQMKIDENLTVSKVITLITYTLFTKHQNIQTVNDSTSNSRSLFVSIRLNPLTQIDDFDGNQHQSTTLPINDDEELIKSDIPLIVTSNFCENDTIELRLDQDAEYENENTN
ncbi:unnamed protein product [Rotaria magnacalcarata]|uniref:EF-hand domain-containing protein n=1 Tax=Rotaria magnacalcarata TaxID=392030 RepID=A0A816RVA8_9BILA|nr:unnamed protein product [Rotaria magnacalcarata]CAF2077097.1 unnamed protein product [Rotaria magnacalcarata]